MNVVIWARVSSREQREGYSIDAQLRATREKVERSGWTCIREFIVAESAKRGAERLVFNEMYRWVRSNARKQKIAAIVSHKLDRICRNMRDAVRMQELEDQCGVHLAFVDNQFGPGAAGALSFNVMAAVAQYYSDNLRNEVLKGIDEKVRQGWPTGLAPYGYMNVPDRNEPVQPHPERSRTVLRIFELYATGNYTIDSVADKLVEEGYVYRDHQARFGRTSIAHILRNRFYIGEIYRRGQMHKGKYKTFIDRSLFDMCRDIMHGKNRRTGNPSLAYSGGLISCAYCGQAITGEKIVRKLKGGGQNEHVYYRCANNKPGPDHPKIRWRECDLEMAIIKDLHALRFPTPEIAGWFRQSIHEAFADIAESKKRQLTQLNKRKTELANMQQRLLDAYLAGTLDQDTYSAKSNQLKSDLKGVEESYEKVVALEHVNSELGLKLFDWSQNVGDLWLCSNNMQKREILNLLCLNRTLSDVSLVLTKTKPFDFLAERLAVQSSRGDRIRTYDPLVPNQMR
jgi:site-specific DNA recombinase